MRCGCCSDGPLAASCSTSVGVDLEGIFSCTPAIDGNAGSFGNSPASCITFQDSHTLQLSDYMASLHAMDASSSSQLALSGLSPPSADHWSQSFLAESPEMHHLKGLSHGYFTDPSTSEYAMNNLPSFEHIPLLDSFHVTEARPSHLTQFSEILKATQQQCNFDININGNLALSSLWDTQLKKNLGLEEEPKFSDHATESNSEPVRSSSYAAVLKKPRIETPSPLPTFKVRKEKLGDRITALQQLVSPFGKTDTASVLFEAIEYIKILHEQVRTLSSPYFRNGSQIYHQQNFEQENYSKGRKLELRSRGLCLVPISSTFAVACGEIPAMNLWSSPGFDLSYI